MSGARHLPATAPRQDEALGRSLATARWASLRARHGPQNQVSAGGAHRRCHREPGHQAEAFEASASEGPIAPNAGIASSLQKITYAPIHGVASLRPRSKRPIARRDQPACVWLGAESTQPKLLARASGAGPPGAASAPTNAGARAIGPGCREHARPCPGGRADSRDANDARCPARRAPPSRCTFALLLPKDDLYKDAPNGCEHVGLCSSDGPTFVWDRCDPLSNG
jgi:hypothetical protein